MNLSVFEQGSGPEGLPKKILQDLTGNMPEGEYGLQDSDC